MENASKAVIMAGSILIAIGVISLALYVYSAYRAQAASDAQLLSISQITSFNRFYESYKNSSGKIRGVDVINIYNKAADDSVDEYEITMVPATIDVNLTGDEQSKHYLDLYKYSIFYDANGRVDKIKIEK